MVGGQNWLVHPELETAAVGYLILVAVITFIARNETRISTLGGWRWMPGLIALIFLVRLAWPQADLEWGDPGFSWILAGLCVFWMLLVGGLLKGKSAEPESIQRAIGQWIVGFLLWQAALCALAGYVDRTPAMILMVLFPLCGWVGRWVKGS